MYFEGGYLYHIYNQGNNKGRIFFSRENYLFFLKKIQLYVLPYADILAWCLMPNHFHLMVRVNRITRVYSPGDYNNAANNHPVSKQRSLNDSIAIMLRSYARAINKQENRSGSLFREDTKAINLTQTDKNAENWYSIQGVTYFKTDTLESNYPNRCFHYIHTNPVKAGLAKQPEDWEFSSAKDIIGDRNGKLINRSLINEYDLKV